MEDKKRLCLPKIPLSLVASGITAPQAPAVSEHGTADYESVALSRVPQPRVLFGRWRIYRVHLFATSPRIFTVAPPLDGVLQVRPELWRASF